MLTFSHDAKRRKGTQHPFLGDATIISFFVLVIGDSLKLDTATLSAFSFSMLFTLPIIGLKVTCAPVF